MLEILTVNLQHYTINLRKRCQSRLSTFSKVFGFTRGRQHCDFEKLCSTVCLHWRWKYFKIMSVMCRTISLLKYDG